MSVRETRSPRAVIERLQRAQNQHDLEGFLACFEADYQSEQPAHPARTFRGTEQVRQNWSAIFHDIRDFRSELLGFAEGDKSAWAEWHWSGTQADGTWAEWRGVTLFGVREGRIVWGRLYMEPVEQDGAGIDQTMERMARGHQPSR